jgi:hypothetical protein
MPKRSLSIAAYSSTESLLPLEARSPRTTRRVHADRPRQLALEPVVDEPVLADDRATSRARSACARPTSLQRVEDLALGLGVDDVDVDRVRLPKRWMRWIAWMKSLNLSSMPTKTAVWQWRWKLQPLPAISGFVERYWRPPVAEVDDRLLALVEILRAVDADGRRASPPRSRAARPRGRAR